MKSINSYQEAKYLINETLNKRKNGKNKSSYFRGQIKDTNELVPNIIRKKIIESKKKGASIIEKLES